MFPSQRPGTDLGLRSPTGPTGVVAAADVLHSDTSLSLYRLPVSPGPVLDVPAELQPEDLVVLQHLVGDTGTVVVALINTVQAKLSGFLDRTEKLLINLYGV